MTSRHLKAVSEVTAVVVMVMIAVAAAFGVKLFVDSQVSRLPSMDTAIARYSVSYTAPNRAVVVLIVSNLLSTSINVTGVTAILSDGSQVSPAIEPRVAQGRSDVEIVFTLLLPQGTSITNVLVSVTDVSTGRTQVITATGS